jgi:hypothetical protein
MIRRELPLARQLLQNSLSEVRSAIRLAAAVDLDKDGHDGAALCGGPLLLGLLRLRAVEIICGGRLE